MNITVAGVGSGSEAHLTHEVKNAIENSDVILANSRFKNLIPADKTFIELKNFNEAFDTIKKSSCEKISILVSGDSGLYSLLPLVKKNFQNVDLKVLPGISSLQIICSYALEVWDDAKIISGHGRFLSIGKFLNLVERNRIVILFCDKFISPQWACKNLIGLDVEVFIGQDIGGNDEKFFNGKPEEFISKNFSTLSIILIRNNNVYFPKKSLRDSDFLRDENIVMTNENVRAVILSKFNFNHDSVFFDIGAGSGSVSVSVANENPDIEIYSIEHKINAVNLISKNISKFHLHNINLYHGRAVEILKSLPTPTDIFIGGSDGELKEILDFSKKVNANVVVACVTLENFNTAYDLMKNMKNFEVVQVSITSSKKINDLTLMNAKNPIMILSGV